MNLENMSRHDMIVGGLALFLAIGLILFPWFDFGSGPACDVVSCTSTATGSPDGWLGILAFIAALAVVADLAIERFSPQTEVPAIGDRTNTRFVVACVAAFFVALKFLFHIHFSIFGWGFYVIVILTAALVYFALEGRNAAPMTVTRPGRTTSTTATTPGTPPGSAGTPPGSASQPPPGSSSGTGPAPGAPGAGPTAPPEPGGSTTPPRD